MDACCTGRLNGACQELVSFQTSGKTVPNTSLMIMKQSWVGVVVWGDPHDNYRGPMMCFRTIRSSPYRQNYLGFAGSGGRENKGKSNAHLMSCSIWID